MVMIEMLWARIATDGASVFLRRPHLVNGVPGELVATVEIRSAV